MHTFNEQSFIRKQDAVVAMNGSDFNLSGFDYLNAGYCIDAPEILPSGAHGSFDSFSGFTLRA